MRNAMINPNVTVIKTLIYKSENDDYYGEYGCELQFSDGTSLKYALDKYPDLDDVPCGIYEWTGKDFIQIENWEA